MKNTFYNWDNSLTKYAFCCGYVQRKEKNGKWKKMYMEHNHFHVLAGEDGEKYKLWEVFEYDQLTKARKFFKSIKL